MNTKEAIEAYGRTVLCKNMLKPFSGKICKKNLENINDNKVEKRDKEEKDSKDENKDAEEEIENNMKKILKYSYSSEEIHYVKNDDEFIPKLIEKDLKEYSLIKNKRNLNKGFERLFQNVEKLDKEKK